MPPAPAPQARLAAGRGWPDRLPAALADAGVRISMTEANHCYENSQAERLNGILKQEYGLGCEFADKQGVAAAVREAVWLYNHRRPHQSLRYRCPMAVHTAA